MGAFCVERRVTAPLATHHKPAHVISVPLELFENSTFLGDCLLLLPVAWRFSAHVSTCIACLVTLSFKGRHNYCELQFYLLKYAIDYKDFRCLLRAKAQENPEDAILASLDLLLSPSGGLPQTGSFGSSMTRDVLANCKAGFDLPGLAGLLGSLQLWHL